MEELRAYWKDRTPQLGVCVVKEINFEDKTASITNGCVRVFPMLDEIEIIRPTGIPDCEDKMIYEGDYVEDKETIYLVTWNKNQTAFWLSPIKSKINEDFIFMAINNQTLGNGYLRRKDLKIIGNKFTTEL